MNDIQIRPILGKYIIKGKIFLKTGTRVGGSDLGISIGGIDNPIIRNPLNGEPYVPGSSLKGKMRSLLERLYKMPLQAYGTGRNAVKRHECTSKDCKICRLFGSSPRNEGDRANIPSRLIVRDAHLTMESKQMLETMETDVPYAEWKSENSLDRVTCHASPRSAERVPAGTEFEFELIYTAEDENHINEDLENIIKALELIEDDYIGSSGSRGYGKVEFKIEQLLFKSEDYYTGKGAQVKEAKVSGKALSQIKEELVKLRG
ncbi:MAG: type III-A CRISPR-associated RAMP protein Csm3 [Pseudothermotoga sp.]